MNHTFRDPVSPGNLPAPLSRFIGRGRETAEVLRLLAEHRLVTLIGPGGSGKTRLALRVATDLLGDFPDGVWFLDMDGDGLLDLFVVEDRFIHGGDGPRCILFRNKGSLVFEDANRVAGIPDDLFGLGFAALAWTLVLPWWSFPVDQLSVAVALPHGAGSLPVAVFALWGIVLAGTIGSWVGATIMYWASRVAGRPLVMRYGKYLFISPEKVEGAERWAAHYGAMGIFISRLLPVVRHLIGIPAGIVRMDYKIFSLYTLVGSAAWCAVLCWLGVKVGGDISKGEMHKVTYWLIGFLAIVGAIYYFFVHRHMRR